MTLLEYLEQDKSRFQNALLDAGTTEKCIPVLENEADRLLLKFNEDCTDPAEREAAAYMLQTLRLSAGFTDMVGKVNVWEKNPGSSGNGPYGAGSESGSGKSKHGKKSGHGRKLKNGHKAGFYDDDNAGTTPLGAKVLMILAGVTGIAALVIAFLNSTDSFRVTDLLLAFILAAASVGLGIFAGTVIGKRKAGRRAVDFNSDDFNIEKRADVQKIYTEFHNMICMIDRNLENLSVSARNRRDGSGNGNGAYAGPGTVSERELELYAGLLEAGYSGDGTYALEKIAEVKLFLHRNKIEAVDYDGSNGELFDFMPARNRKTIRPAFVTDGKVLKRGLAAAGDR